MPSSFKEDLKKFLRDDQFSDAAGTILCYSTDASGIERRPLGVLWPENAEQVSKIIILANEYKVPITPRGGGTSLVGSAVPIDSIVVDLSRMKTIHGIIVMGGGEKKEFNCIVDAGVTIAELNEYLKKDDLYFPVIPSSHKVCTIGGVISTNAAGNRAIKYGKAEKWVEEIDFVDGSGEIIKISDIKDICGKEGLLGIITRAKLKITKLPRDTTMDIFEFENIEEMMEKLTQITWENILSVEIINKKAGEYVGLKHTLFVEYLGNSGKIEGKEMAEVWAKREGIYAVCAKNGYPLICDPQIPAGKLKTFVKWADNKNLPIFGHAGIGIIHVLAPENNYQLLDEVIQMSIELGGEVSGEHGIGIVKSNFVKENALIKKLKKRYDPENIMNRGKMI